MSRPRPDQGQPRASGGIVGPVLVDGKRQDPGHQVVQERDEEGPPQDPDRSRRQAVRGKRILQVRVNGVKGMVALKITIKLGKTTHTYTRFVLANKKVAVKNLPIPAKTAKVTVSLIG